MKVDWKRKLTSRKFWAAVAGFVSMLLVALGRNAETAQTITGLIMAGASLIAYMIGEGLADSAQTTGTSSGNESETQIMYGFTGSEVDDNGISDA